MLGAMSYPAAALLAPALLAAAVAACGDDASSRPPEAAETEGFPVTVEHDLGTTDIPAAPERVVTVGLTEQDTVLALGLTPVGVTEWYGDQPHATWPWAQDELGDAEPTVLSQTDGLQYEAIAALDPDLILGLNAGLDEESYERLSEIAPTVAHPPGPSRTSRSGATRSS
jgi:iron complex transport system substrate-binding protein